MRRRDFITLVGGAAVAWPFAAGAQKPSLPIVALVAGGAAGVSGGYAAAFRQGLGQAGYVEDKNVAIEYHWLNGQYSILPALMADLVRRQVAVIATPANRQATLAAKVATATIPIVFGVASDPVQLGLVESLARPGGNATGFNFFGGEVTAKRFRMLHDLLPKAVRVAVLVNPVNPPAAASTLQDVKEVAPTLGLQVTTFNASTSDEIDSAFAALARERVDALFVGIDQFFESQREQFVALAARYSMPASYQGKESVLAGGLMSYGTDYPETFRQVGAYAGKILAGAKPSDLPVLQATKFEFVLNLKTARELGIDVPPGMLSIADEVIE
jgi:putative tryptophan/tyrosine transport system substrate-binding protein